ncbi:hypothetical protein U14_02473 [Candidatus Moduliflexus flocculans]|uniref:DUF5615 domain-containing protein n=1 Tax=Candidatus Moduliflexus flocculans TaxID=1499966 RepID=A0A081BLG4_9BACT|nr:hypothetical protein U14_02473 [Candidatus Moduliflexus flocculans]
MNSLYLRIYTDEDAYETVARALRDRGYDAISTQEAGKLGHADEEQLAMFHTRPLYDTRATFPSSPPTNQLFCGRCVLASVENR